MSASAKGTKREKKRSEKNVVLYGSIYFSSCAHTHNHIDCVRVCACLYVWVSRRESVNEGLNTTNIAHKTTCNTHTYKRTLSGREWVLASNVYAFRCPMLSVHVYWCDLCCVYFWLRACMCVCEYEYLCIGTSFNHHYYEARVSVRLMNVFDCVCMCVYWSSCCPHIQRNETQIFHSINCHSNNENV